MWTSCNFSEEGKNIISYIFSRHSKYAFPNKTNYFWIIYMIWSVCLKYFTFLLQISTVVQHCNHYDSCPGQGKRCIRWLKSTHTKTLLVSNVKHFPAALMNLKIKICIFHVLKYTYYCHAILILSIFILLKQPFLFSNSWNVELSYSNTDMRSIQASKKSNLFILEWNSLRTKHQVLYIQEAVL